MRTKIKHLTIFLTCLIMTVFLTSDRLAAQEAGQDINSLRESIQRLKDVNDVQKVMSLHEYYLSAEMHCQELEAIWAQKTPGVSFGQNYGIWVGLESIQKYYCEVSTQARKRDLEEMNRLFPEVKNVPENLGIGNLNVHALATPIIEVAGDGKTAKGLWYSPGFITLFTDGKRHAYWMWEKYAVDFVKEDGEWKIWHFNVYTDFRTPYEKSWVDSSLWPSEPGIIQGASEPEKPGIGYKQYSPMTVPKLVPRPPEPYYTFSETFSYGP